MLNFSLSLQFPYKSTHLSDLLQLIAVWPPQHTDRKVENSEQKLSSSCDPDFRNQSEWAEFPVCLRLFQSIPRSRGSEKSWALPLYHDQVMWCFMSETRRERCTL